MLEPRKSAKPKSRRRPALAAIPVAGLLFLGSTVSSQAFTPDVIEQIDHFVDCFGWMITDPEMHNAKCSPANYIWPHDPVSGSGDGAKPVIVPPGNEDGDDEGGVIV